MGPLSNRSDIQILSIIIQISTAEINPIEYDYCISIRKTIIILLDCDLLSVAANLTRLTLRTKLIIIV